MPKRHAEFFYSDRTLSEVVELAQADDPHALQDIALAARIVKPSRKRKLGRPARETDLRRDLMEALAAYSNERDAECFDALAEACVACLETELAEEDESIEEALHRLDDEITAIMSDPRRGVASAAAWLARELNLLGDANDGASLEKIADRFRKAQ